MAAHFESVLWTGASRDTIARWPLSMEAWLVLKTETQAASGVGQWAKREIIYEVRGKCAAGRGRTELPRTPSRYDTYTLVGHYDLSIIALPTSL